MWPDHDGLDYLYGLRVIRPDFRATLFACPGRADPDYWDRFPPWLELAVHGWTHAPLECATWTLDEIAFVIDNAPSRFVAGFKAPFWTLSDACYAGLHEAGWWVADHPRNDARRPSGLRSHILDVGPDHWHGHIGNDCGNGLEETWDHVVALVRDAPSFELMSETVTPWQPALAAA